MILLEHKVSAVWPRTRTTATWPCWQTRARPFSSSVELLHRLSAMNAKVAVVSASRHSPRCSRQPL